MAEIQESHQVFQGPERLQVPPAYTVVVDYLRRAIHLGEYQPGSKLPPERQHAEQLGVSRVTLREAIRVLEGEGYLETRRGSKGGVTVLRPQVTREQLRERLRNRRGELLDIQQFRVVNEGLAATMASERATDEDLAALEAAIEELERSEDLGAFRRSDSAFHLTIAAAARSPLLRKAVEDGRAAMFEIADAIDPEMALPDTLKAHRRILAAIRERDGAGAAREMVRHLEATVAELREFTDGSG